MPTSTLLSTHLPTTYHLPLTLLRLQEHSYQRPTYYTYYSTSDYFVTAGARLPAPYLLLTTYSSTSDHFITTGARLPAPYLLHLLLYA